MYKILTTFALSLISISVYANSIDVNVYNTSAKRNAACLTMRSDHEAKLNNKSDTAQSYKIVFKLCVNARFRQICNADYVNYVTLPAHSAQTFRKTVTLEKVFGSYGTYKLIATTDVSGGAAMHKEAFASVDIYN